MRVRALAAVLVLCCACGSAPFAKISVLGNAVDIRPTSAPTFSTASTGRKLTIGDELKTDATGYGEVTYFSGGLTRLDTSTTMVVEKLHLGKPRVVSYRLDAGRTWNRIAKLTGKDGFSVRTPVAVATVRGTAFVVECAPGGCGFVVVTGIVHVRTKIGLTVDLHAGQAADVGDAGNLAPVRPPTASENDWIARNTGRDTNPAAASTPVPAPSPSPRGATPRATAAPTPTPKPTPTATPPKPGAKQIVFVRERNGVLEIWTMNPDGTGQRGLTATGGKNNGPAVAPDGRSVMFTSDRSGRQGLWIMNIDGSNPRLVTDGANEAEAAFSPDGSRIAFISERDNDEEIYTAGLDGSGAVRITDNPGLDETPIWSPDGKTIVFQSQRTQINPYSLQLYAMNPDGTNVRRLTNDTSNNDVGAAYSPDGTKIAWTREHIASHVTEIWLMNADGSNQHMLATNDARWKGYRQMTWAPDGASLYYAAAPDSQLQIYQINVDGSNTHRVTEPDDFERYEPAFTG